MTKPRTIAECKKILIKLAIEYSIPPKLISERLLSQDDKEDMVNGFFTVECLDCHIKTWKQYGMCNYSNGTGKPYGYFNKYIGVREGVDRENGYNLKFTL